MQVPSVLDVEASGFGRGSYPIEVGLVLPGGESFCSLIQPEPDWLHWDPGAEALHGVARLTLLRHGRPPAWVAEQLNLRLAGQTVYCDAWGHDYAWLARLFDVAGAPMRFRLADLRGLLSEDEAARWHGLREQVWRELDLRRHRASSDARVLQLTLRRIKGLEPAPAAAPLAPERPADQAQGMT